ncbi:hypothetical protein AOLI_G00010190 [Acnodon oligacanthus]
MHRCAPRSVLPNLATHTNCSLLAAQFSMSLSHQVRDSDINQRYGDESCSESVFGDTHPHTRSHSRVEEPPDLPTPTCFRSRSHSYLRAIQAGCSQDDDTASVDSDSPPPTATTVRTYSTSTGEYTMLNKTLPESKFREH